MQNKFDFGGQNSTSQHEENQAETIELINNILADAKKRRITRPEIAFRISRLLGKKVSEGTINGWTSPSRSNYNIPFYVVPALCEAIGSTVAIEWLTKRLGGVALFGDDKTVYEIGKEQIQFEQSQERLNTLKLKFSGGAS